MITRKSSRIILLNPRNDVFMFRSGGVEHPYWVLPGGAVDPGETWEQAALRELFEETGVGGLPLGPCVWHRDVIDAATLPGKHAIERYFVVGPSEVTITNEHQLEYEKAHYTISGWWSVDAIRASNEVFYPEPFADLLAPIVTRAFPDPPVELFK